MEYNFSVIALLKEGFRRSYGYKWTIMGAMLMYGIVSTIVGALLEVVFPTGEGSVLNDIIASLISIPFTVPLLVGISMLGIKIAREEETTIQSIFDYYKYVGVLSLTNIVMTMLIMLGFMLLFIPGMYLAIAYTYALVLTVDRDLSMWEAMELSRKTISKQWFKFFGLAMLSFALIFVSALFFGIGLIWTIPAVYISYGLLYKNLFDSEEE